MMNNPMINVQSSTTTSDIPGLQVHRMPQRRLSAYRLAVFDMDATLIATETIDELAREAGCEAQVSALTQAAMSGQDMDFSSSLRRRVALLKGLPEQAMVRVRDERMSLTPGALTLVHAFQAAGLWCVLATGGFTFFAHALQKRLGLNDVRANALELHEGRLSGMLLPQPWGDVCDAQEKRRFLIECCQRIGASPEQAIAIGDGANDLPMMQAAGLSVAYRAKPAVREHADICIDNGGLDSLLTLFEPPSNGLLPIPLTPAQAR
jgi:phosphoserine phosphatase